MQRAQIMQSEMNHLGLVGLIVSGSQSRLRSFEHAAA